MVRQLLATTALVVGMSVAAWAEDKAQQPSADATVPPAAAPSDTTAAPQGDTTAAPQDDAAAAPQSETAPAAEGDTAAAPQPEAAPAAEGDTAAAPQPEAAPAAEGDTAAAPQPEAAPAAEGDTAAAPQPEAAPAAEGDTAAAPAEGTDSTSVGRATPGDALIVSEPENAVRAGELIGTSVVSAEGEEIGEVNDLIFDDQKKLTGVVVSIGGFLGIGEKWVGINWAQAEMRADPESGKERIFVGLTKADLEAAPDFKTQEQLKSEADAAAAAAQSQSQMPAPADGGSTTTQ
jgi:sporulation protein YlmC with PRC-barrel domain